MITALFGTKLSQSQTFTADGKRIPVTTIQAGPCWVTQINDMETYRSIQLGFGASKHMNKPKIGHIKKAGLEQKPRFLREIRVSELSDDIKIGNELKASDVFVKGDKVEVVGTSKGKGFASAIKRHHFRGGPRTHGQSDRERAPGSIGQTTTPGRVYKGKRMAGRMGNDRVTQQGLEIVSVNPETNIITIKGLVPGARNGLLLIQKAG